MLLSDMTTLNTMLWSNITRLITLLWSDSTKINTMLWSDITRLNAMLWSDSMFEHCDVYNDVIVWFGDTKFLLIPVYTRLRDMSD